MSVAPGFTEINTLDELRSHIHQGNVAGGSVRLWLPEGLHLMLGGTELSVQSANVTLRSSGEGAVIDAEKLSRVATVSDGGSLTLEDGILVTNGQAQMAGCVLIDGGLFGGSLMLIRSHMSDCQAESGGAIMIDGGSFHMYDSSLVRAHATCTFGFSFGGAVVQNSGSVHVEDSVMQNTSVRCAHGLASAGAIQVNGGTTTIINSTVSETRASSVAGQALGGAFAVHAGLLTILDSQVGEGSAVVEGGMLFAMGGAIYCDGGEVTLVNTALSNLLSALIEPADLAHFPMRLARMAALGQSIKGTGVASMCAYGGAVHIEGGSLRMTSVVITNATALTAGNYFTLYTAGGGVHIDGGTAELTACTIRNATASAGFGRAFGGGLYIWSGVLRVTQTTFADCTASSSIGGAYGGALHVAQAMVTLRESTFLSGVARSAEGDASGGGIHLGGGSTHIVETVLQGCLAVATGANGSSSGGGFAAHDGTHVFLGGSIQDSHAVTQGGVSLGGGACVRGRQTAHAYPATSVTFAATSIERCSCMANTDGGRALGGGLAHNGTYDADEIYVPYVATQLQSVHFVDNWVRGGGPSATNASQAGSALLVLDPRGGFTATLLSVTQHCEPTDTTVLSTDHSACAHVASLIHAEVGSSSDGGSRTLNVRGMSVDAPGCALAASYDRIVSAPLRTCAPIRDAAGTSATESCGPDASCREAPVLASASNASRSGTAVLSSIQCACSPPRVPLFYELPGGPYGARPPELGEVAVALAPYEDTAGCLVPLYPAPVWHVSEGSMTVKLSKTQTFAPTASVKLNFGAGGTDWSGKHVGWFVRCPLQLPFWLTPMEPLSGSIPPPDVNGVLALANLTLMVQSAGLQSRTLEDEDSYVTNVSIGLLMGGWDPRGVDHCTEAWQATYENMTIRVSVSAVPVASQTELIGEALSAVPVGETSSLLTFMARDVNGLPLGRAGASSVSSGQTLGFTGELVWPDPTGQASLRADVVRVSSTLFQLQIAPQKPGPYVARVWLGSELVPFSASFEAHCPKGKLQGLPMRSTHGVCLSCISGMDCDGRVSTVPTLKLQPNFWRMTNMTTDIFRCPTHPNTCIGGDQVGSYCKEGLTGPLCQVCVAPHHYLDLQEARCLPCSLDGAEAVALPLALLFVSVCAGLVARRVILRSHHAERATALAYRAQCMASRLGVVGKTKLCISYFQARPPTYPPDVALIPCATHASCASLTSLRSSAPCQSSMASASHCHQFTTMS